MLCEQNGLGLWGRTAYFAGGIQSIQSGHAYIHHGDIWPEGLHVTNGLLPIGGFRNDLKSFALEQGLQALAHEDMVIS
jgi:hypothetical protein